MRRKFLPMFLAAFAALAAFAPDPVRAQDADPVAALLRAEADRRDAAAAQLAATKARLDSLNARLDAVDARIAAAAKRLDAAMTRLTASMDALETALAALRRSMDAIDARLRVVETAPPAPTPVPEPPAPPPGPTAPPAPAPASPFEWTTLTPSADTRTFYVSTSGNDDADGLTPATAVRTPMVAYARLRTGFPDWMLLKRGDTWDAQGTQFAFVGEGGRSGRSAEEPIVIGSYGDSTARPRLLSGRFRPLDGDKHIRVVGLSFEYARPLITGNGLSIIGARVEDVLVEDCVIVGYTTNVQLDGQGKRPQNIRIRGCVVADAISQGILASGVDGLLIESCVFDHNGWREDIPGFPSNGFTHNMYLAGTNTGVVVRDTISARASSHAISMSAGGLAVDNLVLQSPIGIWGHMDFAARNNVVLDARDIQDGGPRGMAIGANEIRTADIRENVIAHAVLGTQCHALELSPDASTISMTVADNLVYRWDGAPSALSAVALYWPVRLQGALSVTGNVFEMRSGKLVEHDHGFAVGAITYQGNRYDGGADPAHWFYVEGDLAGGIDAWRAASGETGAVIAAGTYPDPARTIETYSASLGGTPTLAWFMAEARKQSKLNWRWAFTARVAANYVRAGFGLAAR